MPSSSIQLCPAIVLPPNSRRRRRLKKTRFWSCYFSNSNRPSTTCLASTTADNLRRLWLRFTQTSTIKKVPRPMNATRWEMLAKWIPNFAKTWMIVLEAQNHSKQKALWSKKRRTKTTSKKAQTAQSTKRAGKWLRAHTRGESTMQRTCASTATTDAAAQRRHGLACIVKNSTTQKVSVRIATYRGTTDRGKSRRSGATKNWPNYATWMRTKRTKRRLTTWSRREAFPAQRFRSCRKQYAVSTESLKTSKNSA